MTFAQGRTPNFFSRLSLVIMFVPPEPYEEDDRGVASTKMDSEKRFRGSLFRRMHACSGLSVAEE